MGTLKDLTGQRFGRLTVLEYAGVAKNRNAKWKCKCDCGEVCVVSSSSLLTGHTQSCGCLHKERTSESHATHGMSRTHIFENWQDIRRRCFDPRRKAYKNYGGRGITVCNEWRNDFQAFFDYVSKLDHFGEGGYSIDRINNNGNYEPGNVRWATDTEQARNKRNTIFVEYNGEKIAVTEAAERSGVKAGTIRFRWRSGKRGDELFKKP